MYNKKSVPPSDDRRWKFVQNIMKKYGYSRDSLIEVLHTVQEYFGYIDGDAIKFVAESLKIPYSKVYGVVTFYHFFTLKPQGDHNCVVCTGTACHIKGAGGIISKIEKKFGIREGETTSDGKLSLLTARCLGVCSMAPVIVADGEMMGNISEEKLDEIMNRW